MRGLALTVAVFLGVAGAAAADSIPLTFTEFYPVTRTENGLPAGPGIELARRLTEGLPIHLETEAVPLRRLMTMARSRPIIVAALGRIPAREQQFQWIGELYRDSLVMVTKKPRPRIDTLEQARGLDHIGVTLGGIAQAMLEDLRFTNIETSLDMTAQARKLAGGRVDAWCALRLSAVSAWTAIGRDGNEVELGAELLPLSVWMAASPPVPPELVEQLRRRFADLQRDGALDAIFASLR
jgi:polar amino acid transport system substrate-binding protein